MIVLKAHFDGKVLVPDEPVDLPRDCALEVHVSVVRREVVAPGRPLAQLAQIAQELPDNPDWPPDGASQHDHYLYGLPKRG
jgi:hypothetical protein